MLIFSLGMKQNRAIWKFDRNLFENTAGDAVLDFDDEILQQSDCSHVYQRRRITLHLCPGLLLRFLRHLLHHRVLTHGGCLYGRYSPRHHDLVLLHACTLMQDDFAGLSLSFHPSRIQIETKIESLRTLGLTLCYFMLVSYAFCRHKIVCARVFWMHVQHDRRQNGRS